MNGRRYGGGGFVQMDAIKEGTCRECGGPIHVGERITWKRGWGASHFECGMAAKAKHLEAKRDAQKTARAVEREEEQLAAKLGLVIARR